MNVNTIHTNKIQTTLLLFFFFVFWPKIKIKIRFSDSILIIFQKKNVSVTDFLEIFSKYVSVKDFLKKNYWNFCLEIRLSERFFSGTITDIFVSRNMAGWNIFLSRVSYKKTHEKFWSCCVLSPSILFGAISKSFQKSEVTLKLLSICSGEKKCVPVTEFPALNPKTKKRFSERNFG